MSFSSEPPLTRRAARDFARATGEQPTVASSPSTQLAIVDELGQPLTRRRLRELRDAGIMVDTAAVTIREEAPAAPAPEDVAAPEEAAAEAPAQSWTEVTVESLLLAQSEPVVEAPVEPKVELPTEPPVGAPIGDTAPQVPVAAATVAAASTFAPRPETKVEWRAPDGHWTRQLEDEDDEDAVEATHSRDVSVSNPTTSALIIPDLPSQMDLGGPLDRTGEILLTGSIPLSPSFSSTGSIDRLADGAADQDDLFDDHRMHESVHDGQPVRASAVASQHALGTPIVSDGKGGGHRGLTVLLIAASALAVVVTGLVIAAIALKLI